VKIAPGSATWKTRKSNEEEIMLDKIFKRWNIGLPNSYVEWHYGANAAKIKRALRWYLPDEEYLHVNKFVGWMLLRLAEVNYNPDIHLAIEQMQPDIYGGSAYRIDIEKLKAAL